MQMPVETGKSFGSPLLESETVLSCPVGEEQALLTTRLCLQALDKPFYKSWYGFWFLSVSSVVTEMIIWFSFLC